MIGCKTAGQATKNLLNTRRENFCMSSYKKIKTPLSGVYILLNKVVSDDRGHFLDNAEVDNPAIQTTQHIHSVIARAKHCVRGEHYHYNLVEDFYVLYGATLVVLYDDNQDSPTYQQAFSFVAGTKGDVVVPDNTPQFFIEDGQLAQVHIPPKVWHGFWALTDFGSVILALGTAGYDKNDYKKIQALDIPPVYDILQDYGIN